MFLLPSVLLGVGFALVLGGSLNRLADVRFAHGWTVVVGLAVQVVIFSPAGDALSPLAVDVAHVATYGLLVLFALANLRIRAFLPVLLGLVLNAIAIVANGGRMPVSSGAAEAAGLDLEVPTNLSVGASRLPYLGDVFAVPGELPFTNVFSVGDILIGLGMAAFIVAVSLEGDGEPVFSPRRLLQPLRGDAYRRLMAARSVSLIGDWLTVGALVGWIYADTRSTGQVAGVLLARIVPPLLGGGVAAVIVDRFPRPALLFAVEVVRAVAVAVALGGVLLEDHVLILAAIAVSGALSAVSGAAVPALVPGLVPDDQLAAANAQMGLARNGARALGSAAAGAALATLGAPIALVLDIATFAVAAALFRSLAVAGPAVADPDEQGGALGGLRHLLSQRRLVLLSLSFAAATLATGVTNASLPRFLDDLGLGAGGYGFGMAALATGLALGEGLVGLTKVGESSGRWIGVALLLMSGLFGLLALADHGATALLLLAAIGFVDGTTEILFDVVVQRTADPRHLGSIFALASSFFTTTMIASIALAPLANAHLSAAAVIGGSGIFLVLAGLIAIVGLGKASRLRSSRRPLEIQTSSSIPS